MNVQIDHQVKAVFDDIVSAAPDPGPTPLAEPHDDHRRGHRALIAVAAVSILLVGVAAILGATALRSGPDAPAPTFQEQPTLPTNEVTVPTTAAEAPPATATPTESTSPNTSVASPTTIAPAVPAIPTRTYERAGSESVAPASGYGLGTRSALGAWGDGFLVVSISGGQRVVPDLTDEQQALFPREVFEVFGPDGLSGIEVGAATGALNDAGLLDPVLAVLDAHPELRDLIENGGPVAAVVQTAEFTLDGEVWEQLEVVPPPVSDVQGLAVVGDRVVAIGRDPSLGSETTVVASTLDLRTWLTQPIGTAIERVAIVMNPSGWMAGQLGDEEMLTPDRLTVAASWDGLPEPIGDAGLSPAARTIALSDGFVGQDGASITYSLDGRAWTRVTDTPADILIEGSLPLDDGSDAVLTRSEHCESAAFRVSENGTRWEQFELDDISTSARRDGMLETWASSLASATIRSDGPSTSWTVEQDNMRLEVGQCRPFAWYKLTDLTSGQTVLSETIDSGRRSEPLATDLQYLTVRYGGEWPFTVIDPASGNTLLEGNLMDGEFVQTAEGPREQRLVATTDGSSWLIADLPDAAPAQNVSARNGDVVLVLNGTTWFRYDLLPDG